MSWYFDDYNGQIFQRTGVQKWLEDREIQLEKSPLSPGNQHVFGPYATQAEAQAFKNAHPPHGPLVTINSAGAGLKDIGSGLLPTLTNTRQFMVRLAEGVLGLALILVGLAHLIQNTPAGNVLKKATFK